MWEHIRRCVHIELFHKKAHNDELRESLGSSTTRLDDVRLHDSESLAAFSVGQWSLVQGTKLLHRLDIEHGSRNNLHSFDLDHSV